MGDPGALARGWRRGASRIRSWWGAA